MSKNIILLYKKDKNNFEEMLKNNLVNPKVLMEQNNNGETVLHHLDEKTFIFLETFK